MEQSRSRLQDEGKFSRVFFFCCCCFFQESDSEENLKRLLSTEGGNFTMEKITTSAGDQGQHQQW